MPPDQCGPPRPGGAAGRSRDGRAQVVFLLDGVGTGRGTGRLRAMVRPHARRADFGSGLEDTLAEAYRLLVFAYRPGDEIHLFGYSRGAYTARSLAGMIRNCGLLAPGRGRTDRRGAFALPLARAGRRAEGASAPDAFRASLRDANGAEPPRRSASPSSASGTRWARSACRAASRSRAAEPTPPLPRHLPVGPGRGGAPRGRHRRAPRRASPPLVGQRRELNGPAGCGPDAALPAAMVPGRPRRGGRRRRRSPPRERRAALGDRGGHPPRASPSTPRRWPSSEAEADPAGPLRPGARAARRARRRSSACGPGPRRARLRRRAVRAGAAPLGGDPLLPAGDPRPARRRTRRRRGSGAGGLEPEGQRVVVEQARHRRIRVEAAGLLEARRPGGDDRASIALPSIGTRSEAGQRPGP
jgi:hypothetical protein